MRSMLKVLIAVTLVALGVSTYGYGAAQPGGATKIRIGVVHSLTGPLSPGVPEASRYQFRIWLDGLNKKGGLYLKKFGRRVPVEFIEYDDRSQQETLIRNLERLILQDKVDLILPPYGTAMHIAAAPIFNKYGYPLLGVHASAVELYKRRHEFPYAFWFHAQPDVHAKAVTDMLVHFRRRGTIGSKVVATYIADQHGYEFWPAYEAALKRAEFQILYVKSYPLQVSDVSPLIREMKALAPDVYISISYPSDFSLLLEQAIAQQFNPKIYYGTVGIAFGDLPRRYGARTIEGVMGAGGCNPQIPGAKEYYDLYRKVVGRPIECWGGAYMPAALQVLEQAVEEVGEIDRKKIRDVIATRTFRTIMGPIRFKEQMNTYWPSMIGQWHGGQFLGVWGLQGQIRPMLVPKPAWRR